MDEAKSKCEFPGIDLPNSEFKVNADGNSNGISLDTARTLYTDKQFFPAGFHRMISQLSKTESDRKIRRNIFSVLRRTMLILPFLLDYTTDIINSGAVKF